MSVIIRTWWRSMSHLVKFNMEAMVSIWSVTASVCCGGCSLGLSVWKQLCQSRKKDVVREGESEAKTLVEGQTATQTLNLWGAAHVRGISLHVTGTFVKQDFCVKWLRKKINIKIKHQSQTLLRIDNGDNNLIIINNLIIFSKGDWSF